MLTGWLALLHPSAVYIDLEMRTSPVRMKNIESDMCPSFKSIRSFLKYWNSQTLMRFLRRIWKNFVFWFACKSLNMSHRWYWRHAWKFIEKLCQMLDFAFRSLCCWFSQRRLIMDRQHASLLLRSIQDDCDVLRDILAKGQIFKLGQPVSVQASLPDECPEAIAGHFLTPNNLFLRLKHHSEFWLRLNLLIKFL